MTHSTWSLKRNAVIVRVLCWIWLWSAVAGAAEITFAHYNIENYLAKYRREGNERVFETKPEKEKVAVVRIITQIQPDILGVAEMGPEDQFQDFCSRLETAGLKLPYREYVPGPDPDRHLALLSRFKIVDRHSETNICYELNGQQEKVERGFLDVTVQIKPSYQLRFIGAHLKSKLPVPNGEGLLRWNEAKLLRRHVDEALSQGPALVVYGDFNDTKDQPAIQEVLGPKRSSGHLTDIPLADLVGDRWTYYRQFTDTYDRIDYILVGSLLLSSVEEQKCFVYRGPDWNLASDHRPIVAVLQVPD